MLEDGLASWCSGVPFGALRQRAPADQEPRARDTQAAEVGPSEPEPRREPARDGTLSPPRCEPTRVLECGGASLRAGLVNSAGWRPQEAQRAPGVALARDVGPVPVLPELENREN